MTVRGRSHAIDPDGLRAAAWTAGQYVLFAAAPIAILGVLLVLTSRGDRLPYDFHGTVWDGARAVLHGHNPYRLAFLDHLVAQAKAGLSPSLRFAVPVYPAPALLIAAPLAALPYRVAALLFTAGSVIAFVAAFRLLGIRDWRCYGAALVSWPLVETLNLGQVNTFLMLGAVICWRSRSRLIAPALGLAGIVALKVFLWPIAAFFLMIRRTRVVVWSAALLVAGVLIGWAVIDFAGLSSYPKVLHNLSTLESRDGASWVSLGESLGASHTVSALFSYLVTAALLGLGWRAARRPGGAPRAFGLTIMAALVCSPVVWPHYLALIFIPIALLSPELSALWLVPLLGYFAPVEQTNGNFLQIVPFIAIELIVIVALALEWPPFATRTLPVRIGRAHSGT